MNDRTCVLKVSKTNKCIKVKYRERESNHGLYLTIDLF